jgi:sugar lactone lactonase YvrE
MAVEIKGFARPKQILLSSDRKMIIICGPPEEKILVLDDDVCLVSKSFDELSLHESSLFSINNKNIYVLDVENKLLKQFDLKLIQQKSIKLKHGNYSSINCSEEHGAIFLCDTENSVIMKFDEKEDLLTAHFDYSDLNQNKDIVSIIIKKKSIFMLDSDSPKLIRIEPTKEKIKYTEHLKFGRGGHGKVRNPSDIRITERYLIVFDNKNYLVQFFDHEVNFLFQIGSKGHEINFFDLPISGFVDGNFLYICDMNNDRIMKMDLDSKHLESFIKRQYFPGELNRPSGVTSDSESRLFIADRGNGVIQLFNKDLEYLDVLKIQDKKLERPSSICFHQHGEESLFAIIERRVSNESELNIYKLKNNNLIKYSSYSGQPALNDPQDMDASDSGYIFIADTLNRRILKVDFEGIFQDEVNMAEVSGNKRILIKTISIRDDNHIFTADFDKLIVYEFNSELKLINTIDFSFLKSDIHVIRAVCPFNDIILLCVRGEHQILATDYSGKVIKNINPEGREDYNWNNPVKIHRLNDRSIIIADKENDRLCRLDKEQIFSPNRSKTYNS